MIKEIQYKEIELLCESILIDPNKWMRSQYVFKRKYAHYIYLPRLLDNRRVMYYIFEGFREFMHESKQDEIVFTALPNLVVKKNFNSYLLNSSFTNDDIDAIRDDKPPLSQFYFSPYPNLLFSRSNNDWVAFFDGFWFGVLAFDNFDRQKMISFFKNRKFCVTHDTLNNFLESITVRNDQINRTLEEIKRNYPNE